MSDVIIAGIGQIAVGEHWGNSLRELGVYAIQAAMEDSGGLRPQVLYAGNMLGANLSHQAHLGTLLADHAGLFYEDGGHKAGIEASTIEAGGASGGAALRQGYMAVASGFVDAALVVGVEKDTDVVGPEAEAATATATDSDFEAVQGLTPTSQAALLMRRYMHEYDMPAGGCAGFPLTAHANGAGNKNAFFRKAISKEAYQKAEAVSDPLNLYDIAPNVDGAAALVLTRPEFLPKGYAHPLVRIAASSSASDTLALHDRPDLLQFGAVQRSVEAALKQANIRLEQVDLFEYYDSYSIFAALSLESAGFSPRGQGWKLAADGAIGLAGQIPCATLGGLKARGNPGGATGVYQAVEAALQLRGEAGSNQIKDACYALVQCMGGPAASVVTHLLERV